MQSKTSIRALGPEAGFTMIELMITIMVGAVLMAIAIPSFQSMIAGNRLTTQANDLVGAINYARSEAISHNTTATFCRANTESDTTCAGSNDGWGFWIVRDAAGTVLRSGVVNLYGGDISLSSTLINDSAAFSSDGLARTGGALITDRTFTVCADNISAANIRTVTIGAGSRISTVKSSGGC